MGRQHETTTTLHSSLALLQERFRQLQRIKEMREERELQRAFSAEPESVVDECERPKWFVHQELVRPSRPLRGPPANHGEGRDLQGLETQLSIGGWGHLHYSGRGGGFENDHVDTSLHL